jgi:hypothetical protein
MLPVAFIGTFQPIVQFAPDLSDIGRSEQVPSPKLVIEHPDLGLLIRDEVQVFRAIGDVGVANDFPPVHAVDDDVVFPVVPDQQRIGETPVLVNVVDELKPLVGRQRGEEFTKPLRDVQIVHGLAPRRNPRHDQWGTRLTTGRNVS